MSGKKRLPKSWRLDDFLEMEFGKLTPIVEGLMHRGDRVVISAQAKAGKTTFLHNLVRCLADGGKFLGRWEATPARGTVALIDTEMDPRRLQD
ncbi:MAG: AAA family ATPase [Acidobacteria bacterium]|nr:AAA family ATPase [Acidobacteriota bacterium]